MADGRGNIVLGLNYSNRDGVQLGARPLGRLGIVTADGSGLTNFQNGVAPTAPAAGCGGPNSVAAGGSSTTIPTRVSIAGGPGLGQFREDGTLGANCSVFNFNPYNYYQTPQTRYGGMAIGHVSFNEHAEVYGRLGFTSTKVRQQIAPSGVFGTTFWTPLANPFISAAARTTILAAANAGRIAKTVNTAGVFPNWRDLNNNGVVDAADDLLISYRRRTVELGERSSTYENTTYQFQMGVRGELLAGWDYDLSFQRGQSNREQHRCRLHERRQHRKRDQRGFDYDLPHGRQRVRADQLVRWRGHDHSGDGRLRGRDGDRASGVRAASRFGVGLRHRSKRSSCRPLRIRSRSRSVPNTAKRTAETIPDECLKLAPASCLGGAGGNTLPIKGSYNVKEFFGEAILPLLDGQTGAKSLDLELGFRSSNYNITGTDQTWKAGLSWRPVDDVLVRFMRQRAARAPSIGEVASRRLPPASTTPARYPCSIANKSIDAHVCARVASARACRTRRSARWKTSSPVRSTPSRVAIEQAAVTGSDTTTFGVVWTPSFGGAVDAGVADFYDINIKKVIETFGAQEVLDQCYISGIADRRPYRSRRWQRCCLVWASSCRRPTSTICAPRAWNSPARWASSLGNIGNLTLQANINNYLTKESQSSSFAKVIDCKGYYGTQCGNPLPKIRWTQRTSWDKGPFGASSVVAAPRFDERRAAAGLEHFRAVPDDQVV
jgi:hypothetical protein